MPNQKPWERDFSKSLEPLITPDSTGINPVKDVINEPQVLPPWEQDFSKPFDVPRQSVPSEDNFLGGLPEFRQDALDMYLNPARAFSSEMYKAGGKFSNTLEQWRQYLEKQIGKDEYIVSLGTKPPTGEKIAGIGDIVNLTKVKGGIEDSQRAFSQSKIAADKLASDIDQVIADSGGMNNFAEALSRGLGGAAFDLPAITALGLPIFMGLKGGSDAIQYGESLLKGVVLGGAEGIMLHLAFKMLNNIPKLERVISGGAFFGAPAVQAELQKDPKDRDWSKAAADIIVGAGLVFQGPKGKEFRQSFYRNIFDYFTKADARGMLLEKKTLLRKLSKEIEQNAESNIGVILDKYKKDFEGIVPGVDFSKIKEDITKLSVEQAVRERLAEQFPGFKESTTKVESVTKPGEMTPRKQAEQFEAEVRFTEEGYTNRAVEFGLKHPETAPFLKEKRDQLSEEFKSLKEKKTFYRGIHSGSTNPPRFISDSFEYAKEFARSKSDGTVITFTLKDNAKIADLTKESQGMINRAKELIPGLTGKEIELIKIGKMNKVYQERGFDGIKFLDDPGKDKSYVETIEIFNQDILVSGEKNIQRKSDITFQRHAYSEAYQAATREPGSAIETGLKENFPKEIKAAGKVEEVYGPAGISSVAIEDSKDILGAWLVENRIGTIERARGYLEKIENPSPGEENALSSLNDFLMVKGPRSDWAKKVARLKSESEKAKPEDLQQEAEKIPPLIEYDPLTGKEISIPAELLNTADWIVQNEKRIQGYQKIADKISGAISKATQVRDDIVKLGSIEDAFRNIGTQTGIAVKNINSVRVVYEEEGLDLVRKIAKVTKFNEQTMKELPFVFENKKDARRTEPEFKEAVNLLEKYFEDSFNELQIRGGLTRTWKERVLQDLRAELRTTQDLEHQNIIRRTIQKVYDTEFEHIPTQVWFEKGLARNAENRYEIMRQLLSIKAGVKRNTIRLSDLVEAGIINKEDLHIRDVIGSYARRLGKDIALLDVKEAGKREGLLISPEPGARLPKGKENYVSAPFHAPVFYGSRLHPTLHDWVWEISGRPFGSNIIAQGVRRGISLYKMAKFYNPLFLPMYDAVQAVMLSRGSWIKELPLAAKDYFTRNEHWRESGYHGVRSQPYANLFTNYQKELIQKSQRFTKNLFNAHNLLPTEIVSQMYNASWNLAWTLDGIMRQASYRTLIKKGYSNQDAAQLAALFHGDYASVPPRTREALNLVFFTPTFKIAMAKLHKEMIKGTVKTSLNNNAGGRDYSLAKGLATTVGIMVAWDLFMTGYMGFDREEWGWKYKRRIMGKKGPEDFIIGFSGPHNIWNNELLRIQNSVNVVNKSPLKAWLRVQTNKANPLYGDVADLINNEDNKAEAEVFYTGRPVPIYKEFDHPANQALDVMDFMLRRTLPIIDLFDPNQRELTDRTRLAKETSKLFEVVTRPFTFRYSKVPMDERLRKRIQGLSKDLETQILNFGEKGASEEALEDFRSQIKELKTLLLDELHEKSFQPKKNSNR